MTWEYGEAVKDGSAQTAHQSSSKHCNSHVRWNIGILVTQGALSRSYYHRCHLRVIIMIMEKKTVHVIRKAQEKQKGVGGKG